MGIVQDLFVIALRHMVQAAGCTAADKAMDFVIDRFTNHGAKLHKALNTANDRAWRTLESSLTGPSMWDFVFKSAEDKAIEEELRVFLDSSTQLRNIAKDNNLSQKCLQELRAARQQGLLHGAQTNPSDLAQSTGGFAMLSEPQAVLDAEWNFVLRIAAELHKANHINLAGVLRLRPNQGSPVLVRAVKYFFRREIETDAALFQGLTISKLDDLSEQHKKGLDAMQRILDKQSEQFANVLDRIASVEGKIDEWMQQQAAWMTKAMDLIQKLNMQEREIRPADSMSIRGDQERQFVKLLIKEYRAWPEEKRRGFPNVLVNVGKLEVATGEFEAAEQDFRDAATLLAIEKKAEAEAHFNAYQAALEQKKWTEALTSLKEAVARDRERFAPFPLNDYEPQRILGAGGFGVVFLCKHPHMHNPRVIKSLRLADLDRDVKELFSEATTLETLEHPSIIRMTNCGFADTARTRPYLEMEFFDGVNLESYVETNGPMSYADVLAIARPVAEALQTAHNSGIFHRDVKPANILVRRHDDKWRVKLIDFGLAIRPDSFAGKASTQGPTTQTIASKSIAGTMHYAAPEQMGEAPSVPIGPHSDVFGFGRTCYFTLFGTPKPDEVDREKMPNDWRYFLRDCSATQLTNRISDMKTVIARLAELVPPSDPPPVGPNRKLKMIQNRIKRIEGFNVVVTCEADVVVKPYTAYDFQRAANNTLTVAFWKTRRFYPFFEGCEVEVLYADGSVAYGGTQLATVRATYS